jgi:hypothetical protein
VTIRAASVIGGLTVLSPTPHAMSESRQANHPH